MIVNSTQDLRTYRQATRLSTKILRQLYEKTRIGVYPREIEDLALKLCQKNKVKPAFKGVTQAGRTYDYATCISINDEILHGIPDQAQTLKEVDLVKIDFGIIYKNFYTDHCFTLGLEKVKKQDQQLLKIGRQAVLNAVRLAKPGNFTGDLGQQMHQTAYRAGFDVFKQYVGHGIGHSLHEKPEIPAFGRPRTGQKLRQNMIICVECQVLAGSDQSYTTENGWTVRTRDGKKGAMFEYMVRVDQDPEILTQTQDWALTST